jgi:hypothetical protein
LLISIWLLGEDREDTLSRLAPGPVPCQVAGVDLALAPGLFRGLGELPVVEAGAEAFGDGLGVLGAVVVAEVVVGQTQGLGEHPALAVVAGEEASDALLDVAAGVADVGLEVGESDLGQDGVAELRVGVLVDAPEAAGVQV